MKAIIIAAGEGTRIRPLTDNLPKCLLKVGSKTLLERQLDAFRACGFEEFAVVVGHMADKFPTLEGVTYVHNKRFKHNNILNSLMCAKEHMKDGFVASYSDLVYQPELIRNLIDEPTDFAVSIDENWDERYRGMEFRPIAEMEKVIYDESLNVQSLGKPLPPDSPAELVGLLKCGQPVIEGFLTEFESVKEHHWGQPFGFAATFERAYLTDFLCHLVKRGFVLKGVKTRGEIWFEIDREEDLLRAQELFTEANAEPT